MTESKLVGRFVGIGVGPGPAQLISVAAWEELQCCDLICYPRATSHESSAALHALEGLELPQAELREIFFEMSSDRDRLRTYYRELALSLRGEVGLGRQVGYLTLGDSMTYSTYGYLINALREIYPQLRHRTYAGITSFAAIAAHFDWPLGEGKERVLLLPCPEEMVSSKGKSGAPKHLRRAESASFHQVDGPPRHSRPPEEDAGVME